MVPDQAEEKGRRPVSAAKIIFRFDRRIRHFGVISAVGKEILSATRPDLQELDPEEETKKLLKQIMLMKGILEGMNRYHGKIRGAIVMREKIMLIMFDGIDKVHIFSADPDFPKTPRRASPGCLRFPAPMDEPSQLPGGRPAAHFGGHQDRRRPR